MSLFIDQTRPIGAQLDEAVIRRQSSDKSELHCLMRTTAELQKAENQRLASVYSENLRDIIYAVNLYDRLSLPGGPLFSLPKNQLFSSQKNKNGIIRVSERTWLRYVKVSMTITNYLHKSPMTITNYHHPCSLSLRW